MSGQDYFTFQSRADGLREASLTDEQKYVIPGGERKPAECRNCRAQVFWLSLDDPPAVFCASCDMIYAAWEKHDA